MVHLRLVEIIRESKNLGSCRDRRVRINRTLAEYKGDDGETYRKAFESKGTPIVPKFGSHETLNNLKYQYQYTTKTRKK